MVPQADDSACPVAPQVHRNDELVALKNCGAGLAPPLQPHLGGPPPHIVVQVLLVIPASSRHGSQLHAQLLAVPVRVEWSGQSLAPGQNPPWCYAEA